MVTAVVQWILLSLLNFFHPFYISMTEIQHNKKTQSLEISVRIFSDDLERSIRKNYNGKVDLMNVSDKSNSIKILTAYLQKHLVLRADGKTLIANFEGFEIKEGSVWSYLEVPGIPSIKTLEITNDILHEYQNLQVNFVHVKANKTDKTEKMDYPEKYLRFVLE